MTRLKKFIGYSILVTFIICLGLGILGATGIVAIQQAALPWVFGIAISQSVGCVVAVIQAEHYFRDPAVEQELREEISQMKIRHAEEMAKTNLAHADELAELKRQHADQVHEIHADYRKRYPPQKAGPFS